MKGTTSYAYYAFCAVWATGVLAASRGWIGWHPCEVKRQKEGIPSAPGLPASLYLSCREVKIIGSGFLQLYLYLRRLQREYRRFESRTREWLTGSVISARTSTQVPRLLDARVILRRDSEVAPGLKAYHPLVHVR